MREAALAVLLVFSVAVRAANPATTETEVELVSLRSIAGWLKARGTEGFLGAGVARALGLGSEPLQARQRGFRSASVLRLAQLLPDESMLFMVQGEDEVTFYYSTPRAGLRRALLSIPGRGVVLPLGGAEAESRFRAEVLYWEDKAANR